ncbi:hypothetical protein FPSE_05126 [Fusarium pseudograminearum CS3096]|uniref:Uncharacterized protein n=1 Tax=Fusarium pseudograminearum (strain CS3096) TaxID=1028729 RepID=K3VM31_FUSPC|nr:hypothetical protein FPSE_05126 [Fusarium pseudograminearum CS3096]EKJ74658.1 hypothetical protein FPSE_05126 [Fusarium pseudograminearum CS3096]
MPEFPSLGHELTDLLLPANKQPRSKRQSNYPLDPHQYPKLETDDMDVIGVTTTLVQEENASKINCISSVVGGWNYESEDGTAHQISRDLGFTSREVISSTNNSHKISDRLSEDRRYVFWCNSRLMP